MDAQPRRQLEDPGELRRRLARPGEEALHQTMQHFVEGPCDRAMLDARAQAPGGLRDAEQLRLREGEIHFFLGQRAGALLRLVGQRHVRGDLQRPRNRRVDLAEEVDETTVRLVDLQVVVLVAAHGLVEELPGEAPAFVEEEVAQGVVATRELAIDLAHHLRQRKRGEAAEELLLRLGVRLRVVRAQSAADVRAGEVEDAGGQIAPLVRELAADLEPRHGERGAAGLFPPAAPQGDVVAEELIGLAVLVEEAGDGTVGGHALERDDGRLDQGLVDACAVAELRHVGGRVRERFDEPGFQIGAADFPRELQRAGGVLEDLHGLDPGDLGEEPAAAGVHEERVPLHLEQIERGHALALLQRTSRLPLDELHRAPPLRLEEQLDHLVECAPRIAEQPRRLALVQRGEPVVQAVERGAQRAAPLLVPAGLTTGVASAVAAPALDAMHAAPGGAFGDFHLALGR